MPQYDCGNNFSLAKTVNTNLTLELAKVALSKSIKKFIFLSTIHVYGKNLNGEILENSKTEPYDYYSETKLNAENELKLFHNTNVELKILRLSNIFGAPKLYNTNIWHLLTIFVRSNN